jgi:hypothetical protein
MVDQYVKDNSDKLFAEFQKSDKAKDPKFQKMVETIQKVGKMDMIV